MRARPVPTRLVAAAAGLVLATGVAACSGGSSDSGSAAPTGAASSSAAVGTAVGAAFDRVASATKDVTSVSGTLETTSGDSELDGTFKYRFTDEGVIGSFAFEQADQDITGIFTPEAIYVGGANLPLPGGRTFIKIGLDESNPIAQTYRGLTESFIKGSDFQSAVSEWRSLGGLKEVGTETVNGVKATKYTGTVDPAKPPAGTPTLAANGYAKLAEDGVTSVTTTIWIGPDGLPLKVTTATKGGTPTTSTLTYTGWGEKVDAEIPPADKVADLSESLGGAAG